MLVTQNVVWPIVAAQQVYGVGHGRKFHLVNLTGKVSQRAALEFSSLPHGSEFYCWDPNHTQPPWLLERRPLIHVMLL